MEKLTSTSTNRTDNVQTSTFQEFINHWIIYRRLFPLPEMRI